MRLHQWKPARVGRVIVLALLLVCAGALIAFVDEDGSTLAAAQSQAKVEATIFSFDGQEFVRTKTTLLTEKGLSAVNTTLEHDTPAYRALIQKHSYIGEVTLFGRKYEAHYAPLTGEDGQLTGALFVAFAK